MLVKELLSETGAMDYIFLYNIVLISILILLAIKKYIQYYLFVLVFNVPEKRSNPELRKKSVLIMDGWEDVIFWI